MGEPALEVETGLREGGVRRLEPAPLRVAAELLPALPQGWPNGSVKGLRARGGFEVDIAWQDGKLVSGSVRSLRGEPLTLRVAGTTETVALAAGRTAAWDAASKRWKLR